MSGERNNVIHVAFRRDGTHERLSSSPTTGAEPSTPSSAGTVVEPPTPPRVDDPLADLYEIADVARFFGVTERQLLAWEKKGLVVASVRRGSRRLYSFRDLVALRALRGLLASGVPSRAVTKALTSLAAMLPRSTRPLHELRVVADGANVVVVDERGSFEPSTGQQLLDFSVGELRNDVVRLMRRPLGADARRTAYDHYLEGCRYDEDPATMGRAAEAYLAALRLDPGLSSAITNLGNLRFREGNIDEAQRLYAAALAIDASQPEAHYNLGFLALERRALGEAVERLAAAVDLDPGFADAHFNLALALDGVGDRVGAREHYRLYLELDPEGAFAELARTRRET